ncbi:hypothetical protein L3X38_016853 [Prunus dulcis]|uniref:Uncharacterized protein n=1 Tax=Prunus dulcis TaxID=3755 RepID=A0AAD4Z8M0_PRUDU|nr:hypothetical protein L3X38_016853 [Prunus dulcis]
MSGPIGGGNSIAYTLEHPTPCVAPTLCPMRAHIGTSNAMGDDPKHYTESFHMLEHPTPHMESVSHAGKSNAACGKSNNWGRITSFNYGRSNSDGNWPKFHFEIRPKPRFSKSVSTQQIDPNLCIRQLELGKRGRNHTSLTRFGPRRWRRDNGKSPVRTSRDRGWNSWFPTGKASGS